MPATAIGTLRLTGAAADTPALRLRAARELAGADLSPPGLPPAAVLVVRRLADPLPRRFAGGEPRVRPDPAWERAVRGRLAEAARAAARPDRRGALPADAAAVVFADQAELLACAVRERVQGALAERWWWRAVRRRLPAAASAGLVGGRDPAGLLAACPREAPAALERLADWGEAAVVAAALTRPGAARALAALAAEHGLERGLVGGRGEGEGGGLSRGGGAAGGGDAAAGRVLPPEPWREWLPAALLDAPIAPEIRCLFGVALGLAAAPHRLRAGETVRQARRWWRAVVEREAEAAGLRPADVSPATASHGEDGQASPPDRSLAGGRTESRAPLGDSFEQRRAAGPAAVESEAAPPPAAPSLPSSSFALPSAGLGHEEPGGRRREDKERGWVGKGSEIAAGDGDAARLRDRRLPSPAAAGAQANEGSRPDAESALREPGTILAAADSTPAAESAPERVSAFGEAGIETRVGGVLYLIHVLLDLGLPEAFERGWRLASVAGPWGTLDLLARGLLGARFAQVAHDPLWTVLGRLAGWQLNAASLRRGNANPAYRVPAAWPAKLADPAAGFVWSSAAGRLLLWSEAGYLLADVRWVAGPPTRQARRELFRVGAELVSAQGGGAPSVPAPRPARAEASSAPTQTTRATATRAPREGAPREGPPLRRARAATAPLARPLPPLPPGCPPRFGRWLAAALPAVRRRLLLALVGGRPNALAAALARAPGAAGDPVARALAVPGRLHLTASHLDLVLPLAAADLVVRRAGLDRDPGWLPACGRVVYFHFE